ncbi:MAG TPA: alcohol dehydrogenase-like regulatory protein ErcA [Methanobacteriaceae archaeon]|nr:alcohol dehydrogenase-like regulatory protein ErcA [Methanobacteriaceae archaeon]
MADYGGDVELRKFVAPEFIFGNGARFLAGRYARNFEAKRALIVTDPGLVYWGWVGQVKDSLEREGIQCRIFSEVSSNPDAKEVTKGAEIYFKEGCDLIVAVGGGSPMDCAKGIGIVTSNQNDIREFEGVDKVSIPAPPLICVPTTAGSSADVSQFAIISDRERKIKMAVISKKVVPDVALIDPETTVTLNSELTAITAFDAISHAAEALVSNASSPITDLHALEALNKVTMNLIPLMNDLENIPLRSNLMLASLNAGLAFSNASLGLVHAMAHSLGGCMDISHGECNAILIDHVIEFNFPVQIERYRDMGRAMGLQMGEDSDKDKQTLKNALVDMKRKIGMDKTLGDLGVLEEQIPLLSLRALKDPCIVTNPRIATNQDIEEIYQNAL